jgi:hypothetical protein
MCFLLNVALDTIFIDVHIMIITWQRDMFTTYHHQRLNLHINQTSVIYLFVFKIQLLEIKKKSNRLNLRTR